jgi:hypothetical protein
MTKAVNEIDGIMPPMILYLYSGSVWTHT